MPGGHECLTAVGTIREVSANGTYSVELANGHILRAHLSRAMRDQKNRLLSGEKVVIELSPFDLSRGRLAERISHVEANP